MTTVTSLCHHRSATYKPPSTLLRWKIQDEVVLDFPPRVLYFQGPGGNFRTTTS